MTRALPSSSRTVKLKRRAFCAEELLMSIRSDTERCLNECVLSPKGHSRRVFERMSQGDLACSVGTVLDLSKGGAKVLSRRKAFLGSKRITFHAKSGPIHVDATVVWYHRMGFRKHVLGLQFIGVVPRTAVMIQQAMQMHQLPLAQSA